jgi:hypothetical protein
MEPEILRRGKALHKGVQEDWDRTAQDGKVNVEHVTSPTQASYGSRRRRVGRLDLFVDEPGDFVAVVGIKSTDWDRVKAANRRELVASHRRRVWRYMEEYLDGEGIAVCAGIIYPRSPTTPGWREFIETYLNDYGLRLFGMMILARRDWWSRALAEYRHPTGFLPGQV